MGKSKKKRFSIAVTGAGRLMAMFFTDGMQRYPHATWYDRSSQTTAAIEVEIQLGESGFIRPADRQRLRRAKRHLRSPRSVDVTVSFAKSGNVETVVLIGSKRRRTLLFKAAETDSLTTLETYVFQIVTEIGSVL